MIRDRLLNAAKKVGRRLFLPEEAGRVSVRTRSELQKSDAGDVDETKLPPIVQGDGDTPGPNHKSDIGRTWASAQLLGGAGIVALDVRSPSEWVAGHLPGALFVPREALATHLSELPGRGTDLFVAVYDATGEQGSGEAAEYLRSNGWPRARRLVGGFAEWVEEGEEVVRDDASKAALSADRAPVPGAPLQIGDTVTLKDGRSGHVWRIATRAEPKWGVLVRTTEGPVAVDCAEKDLA
jgi:rhodanese-related sulfurtransferase